MNKLLSSFLQLAGKTLLDLSGGSSAGGDGIRTTSRANVQWGEWFHAGTGQRGIEYVTIRGLSLDGCPVAAWFYGEAVTSPDGRYMAVRQSLSGWPDPEGQASVQGGVMLYDLDRWHMASLDEHIRVGFPLIAYTDAGIVLEGTLAFQQGSLTFLPDYAALDWRDIPMGSQG